MLEDGLWIEELSEIQIKGISLWRLIEIEWVRIFDDVTLFESEGSGARCGKQCIKDSKKEKNKKGEQILKKEKIYNEQIVLIDCKL